jgi:PAS domain S-box-containing protein
MSDAIATWLDLPDARLADTAASRYGAWLWTDDAARLIWANPAGAAALGPGDVATLVADPADPQRRQLAQLAPRLTAKVRLERLRGFGAAPGSLMTCACSRLTLTDETAALLVVAMDRTLPALPLKTRLARLVASQNTPLAAFTHDGGYAGASPSGQAILGTIDALAAIGADAARADALRDGHATVSGRTGQVVLRRLGRGREAALIAHPSADFSAAQGARAALPPAIAGPSPAPLPGHDAPPSKAPTPEPERPPRAARRHPLRFLWQMDATGRFSLGGDPFTRLIGPATATACGRPWSDINAALHLDPDDRVLRAVATRRTFSGITVRWPVDGSDVRLPVELSALPLHDRARRFVGYRGFGVCRDLDALGRLAARRRDEVLHDSPQRLASSPSNPPMDPPMPLDPPHNVLPFRAANGDAIASLTPVENNAFNELARQLSERLERPVAPPPAIAPETNEPMRPDTGPTVAALRAMLDAVTDAALTLAPDGGIVSANRAARALFGIADTAMARRTVFDLVAPTDHAAVRSGFADMASPVPREIEGRSGDGRTLPLAMTLSRAADGTVFVIFHNLAAKREGERKRHDLRRQLERAGADKAGLTAWASRKLRGPAETITAFADIMIEERFGPLGNAQYGAHLRDIRRTAQHMIGTLDELRDLARIEAGDFSLAPVPLNLNDIVEAAIADQQPQAGRARVIIRSSLAPALPPIAADPAALRQIAASLIAVSIHLANAGGQAIISTARADDGTVMLRLRDTGPGLSDEELASATAPIRLVAPADHATLDNAGVNLALIKALIEASGATLAIRSAAASGTLIEVAFKRAGQAGI